jgi:hypothetical protein
MAKTKITQLLTLFCCVVGLLPGISRATSGSHYTTSDPSISMEDRTPYCVSGQRNCWRLITNTPVFSQISVGGDGAAYGLDSAGNIYYLPLGSSTWTETSLSPMLEIAVASANSIYGLQNNPNMCGSLPSNENPDNNPDLPVPPPAALQVFQYTGSSNFVGLNLCITHISASTDGTVYGINNGHNVFQLVNGSWQQVAYDTSVGYATKVVVGAYNDVWLLTSTGAIECLDTQTGYFIREPGWATDLAAGPGSGTYPLVWIVGATSGSNNLYTFNFSTNSWVLMNGYATKIASGGVYYTLAINGNGVYHYNPMRFMCHQSPAGTTTVAFVCRGALLDRYTPRLLQSASKTVGLQIAKVQQEHLPQI